MLVNVTNSGLARSVAQSAGLAGPMAGEECLEPLAERVEPLAAEPTCNVLPYHLKQFSLQKWLGFARNEIFYDRSFILGPASKTLLATIFDFPIYTLPSTLYSLYDFTALSILY